MSGSKRYEPRRAEINLGRQRRPGRPAFALMLVLIIVFVVMSLSLLVGQAAVTRMQQQRLGHWKMQADMLALSGLERAAAKRIADSGYQGETWRIGEADLDGSGPAEVQIEIDQHQIIRVTARFPSHRTVCGVSRASGTLSVRLPSSDPLDP
jgi:hypothetical protein